MVPDSQPDPEVVETTPPQDHQPSLTDSEIDKENRVVSPIDTLKFLEGLIILC